MINNLDDWCSPLGNLWKPPVPHSCPGFGAMRDLQRHVGVFEDRHGAARLQGCKAEVVEGMPSEHVSPSTVSEPSSIKIFQTLILVLSLSWCNLWYLVDVFGVLCSAACSTRGVHDFVLWNDHGRSGKMDRMFSMWNQCSYRKHILVSYMNMHQRNMGDMGDRYIVHL